MRILLLSDLHLEFFGSIPLTLAGGQRIDDDADVIVLAGDIGQGTEGIAWAARTFNPKPVVYVAGNHEFYGSAYERTLENMRGAAQERGVHFLEQDAISIDGVRFLGATLWSDFEIFGEAKRVASMGESLLYINDFRSIYTTRPSGAFRPDVRPMRRFLPEDAREIHRDSVRWLGQELSKGTPEKTVVVTHHAPHWNSVEPRYQDDLCTGAFASNLERLMGVPTLWLHGHMHQSSYYMVNDTTVIANPRGYMRRDGSCENGLYEPALLIEV